jgi:hypothetical protein
MYCKRAIFWVQTQNKILFKQICILKILYLRTFMKKNYYWSLAAKTPSTDYVQRWGVTQKIQLSIIKLSIPVKLYRKCAYATSESHPQNTARMQRF